jgi:hypothetical protein
MVVRRAANFEEAEAWDLDFWQSQSPEQRLSAFLATRRDVDKVMKARLAGEKAARKDRTHHPRHQDDVRVLQEVRRRLKRTKSKRSA